MRACLLLLALPTLLFAQSEQPPYEPGGVLPAADFVPAASLQGRLHTVGAHVFNDGLHNTYFLYTPDGEVEVTGTPALLTRIGELYALEYLRGVSKTEAFTKALGTAGKAKLDGALGVVRDPFGTIKRVPKGASRFFGRLSEGAKDGQGGGEGSALAGLTGVSKAKAQLAAKLGVNPYTTNEALQQELTAVAQAMAGGGLIVDAAAAAVSGGAGAALSVAGWNNTLQDLVLNSTPEDLRLSNRKKLLALGVDRALAEEFLLHPWFSPWHETIITDALAQIGVNPSAFLGDAVKALTPEDAFFFQRVAQILARYQQTSGAKLRAIRFEGGIITALDQNGTLVVPVSLDYAIWAERTAQRTEEFAALAKSREDIKALVLWTDGQISDRLRDELKKRGITWRTDALAQ